MLSTFLFTSILNIIMLLLNFFIHAKNYFCVVFIVLIFLGHVSVFILEKDMCGHTYVVCIYVIMFNMSTATKIKQLWQYRIVVHIRVAFSLKWFL